MRQLIGYLPVSKPPLLLESCLDFLIAFFSFCVWAGFFLSSLLLFGALLIAISPSDGCYGPSLAIFCVEVGALDRLGH